MPPINFMPSITQFLIGIAVIIVVFLISRVFVLWYWKIDKVVKLLEEIVDHLKSKPKEEEKDNQDLG